MQAVHKIKVTERNRRKQPARVYHLSSFGILNRNGLEIVNEKDLSIIEEENEDNVSSMFSEWLIPVPRPGYIKVKLHDFL
ncbi:MAG TPA: hypothetical protein VJU78_20165 [Chitinophagaceae bacterium]|nr:hypothetical protein [Chitinophagaceae bacterium]